MQQIKKILCPIDFFPASIAAADYAARLAGRIDTTVCLLHVVPSFFPDPYSYTPYRPEFAKQVRQRAAAQLQNIELRLAKLRTATRSKLRVGEVDDGLKREITNIKPDLVVLGTHRRRGLRRWFVGSTTETLLHQCAVPLLVVPAAQKKAFHAGFRRIVVATDLSAGTTDSLAYALSLVQPEKCRITLLHVMDAQATIASGEYRDALLSGVHESLDRLARVHKESGYRISTSVDVGRPDRIIPRILKSDQADLLVMNVYKTNLVDRALLGGTAEHVLRSAACPILLIPTRTASLSARKKPTIKAA